MNDNLWQATGAILSSQSGAPPLLHREGRRNWPLSFAQERICTLRATEPEPACYNVPMAWWVRGRLRRDILRPAVTELLGRHDALRSRLVFQDGRWTAEICPPGELEPVYHRPAGPLADAARKDLARPFDPDKVPHLRVSVFEGSELSLLLLAAHQTAIDGWSERILGRELEQIYTAHYCGRPTDLPATSIQYGDFAAWQRTIWEHMPASDPGLTYWRRQFAEHYEALPMPCTGSSLRGETGPSAVLPFVVPEELVARLRMVARQAGVSLFVVFLSALQGLLSRYTNRTDIAVFASTAARVPSQTRDTVGLFANVLPIRSDFSRNPSLGEMLARVRHSVLGAFAHQTVPLQKLLAAMPSPPPIQVMLAYQNQPLPPLRLPEADLTPALEIDNGWAKVDVMVDIAEARGGLLGRWKYRSDRFDARLMRRMADNLLVLLGSYVSG